MDDFRELYRRIEYLRNNGIKMKEIADCAGMAPSILSSLYTTVLPTYFEELKNCSHEEAYKETGMQAVSYTTGVPAMIGAMMFLTGKWNKKGVHNVEEFDPDPFMEQLSVQGLPWHEIVNADLEVDKI